MLVIDYDFSYFLCLTCTFWLICLGMVQIVNKKKVFYFYSRRHDDKTLGTYIVLLCELLLCAGELFFCAFDVRLSRLVYLFLNRTLNYCLNYVLICNSNKSFNSSLFNSSIAVVMYAKMQSEINILSCFAFFASQVTNCFKHIFT